MNTYLGPKGYTIPKNNLSHEQQNAIRTNLMIKPFTMGAPSNDSNIFPAYRESSNKFYVPHYYGIEQFGPPKEYKLSEGLSIDVPFHGMPRDYQTPIIDAYLNHCNSVPCGGGLLELHTGWGKTCAGLYIVSQLKKKTIIIVHKEFLMNQWIERIQHFLPSARIGRIQGPIIDIENKDIVLCMLQSLVQKDYDASIFSQFGLTIIDEVHHISSQTFSNSLFKVITKYMLGLSATMDRKDGTTNVFKMFLGKVICKVERKTDMFVEVRSIQYAVDDDEFNETILDYRGKPQNSSMISKLCEYNRRTEFIIKTICDFISVPNIDKSVIDQHKREMDQQIPYCEICHKNMHYLVKNTCCDCVKYCLGCMDTITSNATSKKRPKCPHCNKVLKYEQNYIENKYVKPIEQTHIIIMAHNLNILHYIYQKFVCNNLASVGYYIGGMKEAELKKSEKKQVILSTYVMVSEGLDIPSLNAEFLITPKTDVVQTVGRILRAKHAYSHPIIYDFVDSHDLFKRQWAKRRAYYKKQNYKIVTIGNSNYHNNYSSWKVVHEPFTKKEITNQKTYLSETEEEDDSNDENDVIETCLLKIK